MRSQGNAPVTVCDSVDSTCLVNASENFSYRIPSNFHTLQFSKVLSAEHVHMYMYMSIGLNMGQRNPQQCTKWCT